MYQLLLICGGLLLSPLSLSPFSGFATANVEETCSATEVPVRLEIVFLLDRSYTFYDFIQKFRKKSVDLLRILQSSYPDSKFALTAFSDYYETQIFGGHTNEAKDEVNGCYKFFQALSQNVNDFPKSMEKVSVLGGGMPTENQLGGVLFSVADNRVGWSPPSTNISGVNLQRMLVFFTDDITQSALDDWQFVDQEGRRPPKADGSDTCLNSFLPTYHSVGDELRKRGIVPIGFFKGKLIIDYWRYIFKNYWLIENPQIHPFSLDNVDKLAADIVSAVKKQVMCSEEMKDPPAYNTLGL